MKDRSTINNDEWDVLNQIPVGKATGRPLSNIFQEIIGHATEIIRSEVRLARAEVGEEVRKLTRASVLLIVGIVFAFQALAFFLLSAVYALGSMMPLWLSSVIVGAGAGLIAAIFLGIGRAKIKAASLKPEKTIHSLQENVTWIKKQTR